MPAQTKSKVLESWWNPIFTCMLLECVYSDQWHCSLWTGKARLTGTDVPFRQKKPAILGPMFLLGRKSQTKLDQWLKARPTWTNAPFGQEKPDLLGPVFPLGRKSQPYLQEKPAILGPVFPLGRKSQTYLDQCSFCAGKARPTWTNVPFGQEKPD